LFFSFLQIEFTHDPLEVEISGEAQRAQARLDIVDWIEGYYNRERLHTSIDFCTPVDYEARLIAA